MVEIGEYSKPYKCPVCGQGMSLIKKDDHQWKYECDASDHGSGAGVATQRAEEDEKEKSK